MFEIRSLTIVTKISEATKLINHTIKNSNKLHKQQFITLPHATLDRLSSTVSFPFTQYRHTG